MYLRNLWFPVHSNQGEVVDKFLKVWDCLHKMRSSAKRKSLAFSPTQKILVCHKTWLKLVSSHHLEDPHTKNVELSPIVPTYLLNMVAIRWLKAGCPIISAAHLILDTWTFATYESTPAAKKSFCLFLGKLCTKNTSIVWRYIYIFHAKTNNKYNCHKFYILSSFRYDHIQFVQK